MFEVCVEHTFAAAHQLRNYRGKCENLHGHNYKVQVAMEGEELAFNGLLFDFADLKKALRGVVEYLDHKFLNELSPFDSVNPTAENIAKFICEEVQKSLPDPPGNGARVSQVKVWETETSFATYRP
jgi:6-pyruvoyltetrahydropterin/6-carboxytetrahydropterin synthase